MFSASGASRDLGPPRVHGKLGFDKDSRHRGPGTHRANAAELAIRNRVAADEAAKARAKRPDAAMPSVPATSWVSLGPTDSLEEDNFFTIMGVDSGRPNGIAVDPRDANTVYMAVSGGGLWKTFNFGSAVPQWNPATDLQPNLAIGSFALDPANPDNIYIGNGDFVDASGNTVVKSGDGGSTWNTPVELSGTAPDGTTTLTPLSIRSLGVQGPLVLAATDVGLFTSTDGGTKRSSSTTLPNTAGAQVPDAMWSIAQTGATSWVASGLSYCDNNVDAAVQQDLVFAGVEAGSATGCTAGNDGVNWYSSDGATWSLATQPLTTGIGRITVGAGSASGAATVLYAMVGSIDGSTTAAFWRSMDSGKTWADVTGTLTNPSLDPNTGSAGGSGADCADMNLGHDQSWYNQSVTVDPTNPDNVMVGGNLCGARTLNGTSATPTWELISHWLPNTFSGATVNGLLPYVHADWHYSAASNVGGQLVVFAGTDGGMFSSTDVFASSTPAEQANWVNHNHGLTTHLVYQIGTGDPATQDPFVLFAGLQDNGTRFRANPTSPSVFNQPIGGDGIGATVHHATSGITYWGSSEFSHDFCNPSASVDCSLGSNWGEVDPPGVHAHPEGEPEGEGDDDSRLDTDGTPKTLASEVRAALHEDSEPFFVHYSDVNLDTTGQSVLTQTNEQIWLVSGFGSAAAWTAISQDLTTVGATDGEGFNAVTASRYTKNLCGAPGLVSADPFYITKTCNVKSTWVATTPVHPSNATDRLTGPASIDFPPTYGSGQTPGDVYVGSFTGTQNDLARTPPPPDQGYLYRTVDGGKTFTTLVGTAPNQLPDVPVYVAKYDPIVATTIYAATDVGVYITTDDGATWNRMGDGLPIISTRDIYVAKNQDFIRAATYGRGIWEIYPSAAENSGSPGNGDFDRNLMIDWIDVAALSARLGETPAVTTAPFYTWIDDIVQTGTDPVAQINDGDLTALMSVFGDHP